MAALPYCDVWRTGPELDAFVCTRSVNPKTKALSAPPAEFAGEEAMDVDAPTTPSYVPSHCCTCFCL